MANIGTKTAPQASSTPVMHWVTVRDTTGRPHLEMRWSIPGAHAPLSRAA
ncbi:hypothetical protein [Kineococcus rhizosphaerae]|uniref:Uncharacterized protein n=1 Tax=Kineococcus rhizosphaerae TaxID=559628 RepID=A0A2T0R0R8_9ACTN|nr:hypothetical protein [Kineococcus rhizosphaerae]PRY12888.1 hypothetical protein CLV37_10973 [Kineococcus rhizosphaerae]